MMPIGRAIELMICRGDKINPNSSNLIGVSHRSVGRDDPNGLNLK